MTSATKSPAPKASRRTTGAAPIYRGVRLHPTHLPSQFTPEQIKEAVDAAIRKHADALAGRKKA